MKKSLITFLLALACACTVAGAVACKDNPDSSSSDNSSSSSPLGEATLSVTFEEGEGYTFVPTFEADKKFAPGEIATFRLDVSALYTGYPIVRMNGEAIAPGEDDNYSIAITENAEITVSGIEKDVSQMSGTGSFDNAFVVTRPVDLLYIAEQVNAGNPTYVTGSYVLGNDIDCGGEELKVIGDMSTENSYFAGCFSSAVNNETGLRERFTISNFVINSTNANYVGLFGAVYSDLSVTSSALFYGIGIDNFTINASISEDAQTDNRSISAGGLIGYSIGANLWLCNATNGTVNVYGDDSYFSFAGGLIGYQQALYSPVLNSYFPSEVIYSVVDVDVRILRGMSLYAGGISGYLATNYPYGATAFIHNSYATGNVSGALNAGGIAGGLGSYTSISNSYATGNVSARSSQDINDPLLTNAVYCYAYAGGLVGYAENESIVNDSFATGTLSASSASAGYNFTGSIIGGGDQDGVTSASAKKYVVENCLSKEELDLTDTKFLTEKLGWGVHDWVFKKGEYPTIFYEASESTVTAELTVKYVSKYTDTAITVRGATGWTEKYIDTSIQSATVYSPIGNYFLSETLTTNLKADNGYRAYGYYFDEACTRKVPYSYVPQKGVTFYIGFADPTPVLGTYSLAYDNSVKALNITLDEDGIATYSDGNSEQQSYFLYDGETIVILEARLARYFDGEIIVDENDPNANQDANFDINRYAYHDFSGKLVDGGLILYDGNFFTEDDPLISKANSLRGEYYIGNTIYTFYGDRATVQDGTSFVEYDGYTVTETTVLLGNVTLNRAELKAFDEFKGDWTKSANVHKVYTFDGMGGWKYARNTDSGAVDQASGSYVYANGAITFTHDGVDYTASFDGNGTLNVVGGGKTQRYYAEGSHFGTWHTGGVTLELLGIGNTGMGEAIVTYANGTVYELVYELSETDGYVALYYPHELYAKGEIFGYFTHNSATNMLSTVLLDINTGSNMQTSLRLLDNYNGEWICDAEEFRYVEFRFDGNGLYGFLYGGMGTQGQLTLVEGDKETTLTYTLDSTLKGKFTYDGAVYEMTYDEDANAIVLTASDRSASLERKDELANVDFIDRNGVRYTFDGRSNLSTDGLLTIKDNDTETNYTYVKNGEGWTVKNGNRDVGSVLLTDNCYTLTIEGESTQLYIANEFMGNWAVGGFFGLFEIGPTDLNNTIQATFLGHKVQVTQVEVGLLTFRYRDGNRPVTYYVFIVEDAVLGYDVLVVSQYNNLYSGDYSICTKANELYGEWTRNDGQFTMNFDGVTSGSYSNGNATLSWKKSDSFTPYYYTFRENGMMMWSQENLGGTIVYYKLQMLDIHSNEAKADDVFVQKDENGTIVKAMRRVQVDSLYMAEATDVNDPDTVYFFDGEGRLLVDGNVAYEYKIDSFNTDSTAYLTLTKDGKKYFAVLNYKDSSNMTLKIEEMKDEA